MTCILRTIVEITGVGFMARFKEATTQRVLPLENGPKQWQVHFIFELTMSGIG